jgi:hypothetical protein
MTPSGLQALRCAGWHGRQAMSTNTTNFFTAYVLFTLFFFDKRIRNVTEWMQREEGKQ